MRRFLYRAIAGHPIRRALGRACLAATLATAWDTPALAGFEPVNVKGWVESQRPMQSSYLFVHYYIGGGSGCYFYAYTFPIGSVAPGVRSNYEFTIPTGPSEGFGAEWGWRSSYAVIGVYDDESGAVSFGYDPVAAAPLIANESEWDFFTSELTVAVWLQSGMSANVRDFLVENSAPCGADILANVGQASQLVAYSHALPNGWSFFEVECGGSNGDANCDGSVDFFDIDPFLLALFDANAYVTTGCGGGPCCAGRLCAADADDSGAVDFFDIDPFLACLFQQPECQ